MGSPVEGVRSVRRLRDQQRGVRGICSHGPTRQGSEVADRISVRDRNSELKGDNLDVSFAIDTSDDERRAGLYRGEIIVLPATPASLELVRFARKMIEDAFAPYSPRTAYQHLEVTETVQILSRLKPQFIHDPRTRFLLRDLLLG